MHTIDTRLGIREAVHMWESKARYLVSHNMLTGYFRDTPLSLVDFPLRIGTCVGVSSVENTLYFLELLARVCNNCQHF